jgi:DNA-binding MarR family transcriptional regulator
MTHLSEIRWEVSRILGKSFQRGITLRHLRALVALSDLKLVARVSEALGVTQPAVSKQIAELEKLLVRLWSRGTVTGCT